MGKSMYPLLMAGGEMAVLTGEGQEIFMAAVFAFGADETTVQITTAEVLVLVNDLLDKRSGFIPTNFNILTFRLKDPILRKSFV